MSASLTADQRTRLIELNRLEYGDAYAGLTFPGGESAAWYTAERDDLLAKITGRAVIGCGGTKLDMRNISPGCRSCVEGNWSCLFINGQCNTRCFYCPSRQDAIGLPTTNAVSFRSPADYVAYLEQFGFRGMSLSGGEPLLTPKRCLSFLGAAKKRLGDRLHTWLYSNGTLADHDILLQLRDAGLDEIRFDIGATGYSLNKARLAVNIIPTVTVEIPAVPEDVTKLKEKMSEMADAGIGHLNLHQLRLTPHNLQGFTGRRYTYLHGEKVTVLDSELAALELIRHALDRRLELPVNYCSFVYKNRYQKAAARHRSAMFLRKPHEEITRAGYLRQLSLAGVPEDLARQIERLRAAGTDPAQWDFNPSRGRLALAASLLDRVEMSSIRLLVTYGEAAIRENLSYRHPFKEVRLPSGRKVFVERWLAEEREVSSEEREFFSRSLEEQDGARPPAILPEASALSTYECIPEGLQDYF